MDSWFLAAVRGSSGSEKMVADDPLRKLCLGKLRNIPTQLACILLVLLQAFLLNIHIAGAINQLHWMWFIADAAIVALFIASFYWKEWRVQHIARRHKSEHGFQKGLPCAPLSWFVYAAVLGARVCVIFIDKLEHSEEIGDFKISICGTAIICIFFTWSHHHNHESLARRASILSLVKLFAIDLLDTVDVLDVLFVTAKEHEDTFPVVLEVILLCIITLNLIRPSIVLASLFVDHHGSHSQSLKMKVTRSLFELLMMNIPLLVIRSYIAATYDDSISVFLVKNILGILFGLVEIYDCSYDIDREKRKKMSGQQDCTEARKKGDNNELAATNGDAPDIVDEQTELTS